MVRKFLQCLLSFLTVRETLIFFSNVCVLPSELTYMTEERSHSITFSESEVKVHGHDNISFRLIKLCANSVTRPETDLGLLQHPRWSEF